MSSLRPNSILVVDDDPSLRKVLRTSLSMSGFVVEEARDGEDALARVQSDHFDVVLLDIIMPGIGGVEACRRIRAISPKIGIIMITVRDSDDIVHALDAGANDYLVKPFRLHELTDRLQAHLRQIRIPNPADERIRLKESGERQSSLDPEIQSG